MSSGSGTVTYDPSPGRGLRERVARALGREELSTAMFALAICLVGALAVVAAGSGMLLFRLLDLPKFLAVAGAVAVLGLYSAASPQRDGE